MGQIGGTCQPYILTLSDYLRRTEERLKEEDRVGYATLRK